MEFSKNTKDKVNVWKKEIKEIRAHDNNYKWIVKNHQIIHDFIISKYKNLNSMRTHLSTLTSIIKAIKGPTSYLYQKYSKEAISIQKRIENEQLDQNVSDKRKENYITLQEIEKRRDELQKRSFNDPDDIKVNLQFLLLSLYTYQPPLRQDYKDMLIVQNKVPNDKDNFLLKVGDKYFTVIQKDKVINSHKEGKFELNETLKDIIDYSLHYYPRKYLLSLVTDPNKPIGKQGFEKLLKECFHDKNIGVDLIRSAYITAKYDDKTFTMRQKIEMAKEMRTSVRMSENIYHKIVPMTVDSLIHSFVLSLKPKEDQIEPLEDAIRECIDKYFVKSE